MNILVIDGQGGGMGRQLVAAVRSAFPKADITAVGANALATSAMLKAGASNGATGENAVTVCARKADFIMGPIGIAIADSLLGEVTPKMAEAVGKSGAVRILLPVNACDTLMAGTADLSVNRLVESAVGILCDKAAQKHAEI